jgi:hypothetical protein
MLHISGPLKTCSSLYLGTAFRITFWDGGAGPTVASTGFSVGRILSRGCKDSWDWTGTASPLDSSGGMPFSAYQLEDTAGADCMGIDSAGMACFCFPKVRAMKGSRLATPSVEYS